MNAVRAARLRLLDRPVRRVLEPGAGEAAQDLLGLGGAPAQGGGVLTIWSYCWRIRSQSIVLVDSTGVRFGHFSSSPAVGWYSRAEPTFFNLGSRLKPNMWAKANPTMEAPCVSLAREADEVLWALPNDMHEEMLAAIDSVADDRESTRCSPAMHSVTAVSRVTGVSVLAVAYQAGRSMDCPPVAASGHPAWSALVRDRGRRW